MEHQGELNYHNNDTIQNIKYTSTANNFDNKSLLVTCVVHLSDEYVFTLTQLWVSCPTPFRFNYEDKQRPTRPVGTLEKTGSGFTITFKA